jgi:hypothetical protein
MLSNRALSVVACLALSIGPAQLRAQMAYDSLTDSKCNSQYITGTWTAVRLDR